MQLNNDSALGQTIWFYMDSLCGWKILPETSILVYRFMIDNKNDLHTQFVSMITLS